MNEKEKELILEKSKKFFKEKIVNSHIENTKKLKDINQFNINPFTHNYLAQFIFGNSEPESLAKVLLYPRILGTSISTTFGHQMQFYCGEVLNGNGSLVDGMDIEFIDCIDGEKKYCQMKAGPQTINKDDVKTITDHFQHAIRLGKTNNIVDSWFGVILIIWASSLNVFIPLFSIVSCILTFDKCILTSSSYDFILT